MKMLLATGLCLLLGLSLVAGCGGSGSAVPSGIVPSPIVSQSPTPSPTPSPMPSANGVTLTFNPTSLQIDINQSESLTATVSNDPNNKGVNWTVICPSEVTACGTMAKPASASGVADTYNAPSSAGNPNQLQVLLKATSVSDPTKFGQVVVFVNPAPTLVNPPPPQPAGDVGSYFSLDLFQYAQQYVQGGTPPYSWNFKSGVPPSGLTLNGGTISGIPTTVSGSTVVVTAMDSANPPLSLNVSVSITINPMLPFTNSLKGSGALPGGKVGARYNPVRHCIHGLGCLWVYGLPIGGATGGIQPYMFSWAAAIGSSLPPGLALIPRANGCGCSAEIDGTPTTAGTYSFVVSVTDLESPPKQVNANYTITVTP